MLHDTNIENTIFAIRTYATISASMSQTSTERHVSLLQLKR
jgi:hypothetical protein